MEVEPVISESANDSTASDVAVTVGELAQPSPGVDGAADGLRGQVLEVLKNVEDPELGVNIVDLGLVYGVEIDEGAVHITYTLTTMGCPIGPMIEAEMKKFLAGVDGISEVNAEMVLRPPWTPEMMSDEAKAALGFF